jgi:hypothetical protein
MFATLRKKKSPTSVQPNIRRVFEEVLFSFVMKPRFDLLLSLVLISFGLFVNLRLVLYDWLLNGHRLCQLLKIRLVRLL